MMSEWQPLSVKPTEDCVVVYFHANELHVEMPDERWSTGYFMACPAGPECCDGSFDWDDDMSEPTHWMRLPDPPAKP